MSLQSRQPPLLDLPSILSACRAAPSILLCCDFDGTLVPLRDNPRECFLAEKQRLNLQRLSLCKKLRVVIVSGRSMGDLKTLVAIPGIGLVGNHGLEMEVDGLCFDQPLPSAVTTLLQHYYANLPLRLKAFPGVWVEDKGLSLTIHYRQLVPSLLPEFKAVIEKLRQELSSNDQLILRSGKQVFEIRPKNGWDKGSAISYIAKQFYSDNPDVLRLYFGDDQTDEDAYRAWPDAWTISVGNCDSSTLANFRLQSTNQVLTVIRYLATAMASH